MNANTGIITLIVLAAIAALILLVVVLILLRSIRRRRNGRPLAWQSRPLRPPVTDADRAQEDWDIARRAARLKWQQDHAALQAARAIQQAALQHGNK